MQTAKAKFPQHLRRKNNHDHKGSPMADPNTPNTYTPDWRVDADPEQADDYDSTDDTDQGDDADTSDDGESE